jgi:DnaJ like chaperone protein
MSWLGKFVGGAFGFVMGGPLGLALGAALGHQLDRNGLDLGLEGSGFGPDDAQRLQMAFFSATFQVMGHIAKADGRVSEAEIETARIIMNRMMLPESLRETAMRLYNEGKRESFPFHEVVDQFHAECHRRAYLLRMFIELQTEAALADGRLHPAEEQLLLKLCDRLHFSRYEYFGLRTRLEAERRLADFGAGNPYRQRRRFEPPRPRETPISEAYATLGQAASATDEEIKRAYRRLISQHHPDKLAAKGVSKERMRKATEQTQKIQKAYDAICKVRKL